MEIPTTHKLKHSIRIHNLLFVRTFNCRLQFQDYINQVASINNSIVAEGIQRIPPAQSTTKQQP